MGFDGGVLKKPYDVGSMVFSFIFLAYVCGLPALFGRVCLCTFASVFLQILFMFYHFQLALMFFTVAAQSLTCVRHKFYKIFIYYIASNPLFKPCTQFVLVSFAQIQYVYFCIIVTLLIGCHILKSSNVYSNQCSYINHHIQDEA